MQIAQVGINNYRNLDGLNISLSEGVNFIVGESSIGKSNLLDMLNTIFCFSKFDEKDFKNPALPLEISLCIELSQEEQGLFEDYCDPHNPAQVNIIVKQSPDDLGMTMEHKETGTPIASLMKHLTYVHYDSLRTPGNELNFSRTKGVGKVLNFIVRSFMKDGGLSDTHFIEQDKLQSLLSYINDKISKIKTFKQYSILAGLEENVENLLAQIVVLRDENNFNVKDAGYGVQFLSLIPLFILERVLALSENRRQGNLITDERGKKYLPLIIGLDEPEVHQYPYAQRALVKYLSKIMLNEDEEFSALLKSLFGIDGVKGQIIIATHSPNVLLNDYKQIIRLYKDDSRSTVVKSGREITLDDSFHKHLHYNFMFIKEAFFSRCVIIAEGPTEVGAFYAFAKRLSVDFDDYGISVVGAGGAKTIPVLMDLFDKFGVRNVAIMDNDAYRPEFSSRVNLTHSDGKDFEEDIYDCFTFSDFVRFLEDTAIDTGRKFFFVTAANKLCITLDLQCSPLYSVFRDLCILSSKSVAIGHEKV